MLTPLFAEGGVEARPWPTRSLVSALGTRETRRLPRRKDHLVLGFLQRGQTDATAVALTLVTTSPSARSDLHAVKNRGAYV